MKSIRTLTAALALCLCLLLLPGCGPDCAAEDEKVTQCYGLAILAFAGCTQQTGDSSRCNFLLLTLACDAQYPAECR